MNLNLKRHKTLKILSVSRIKFSSNQGLPEEKLEVNFDDVQSKLNCELVVYQGNK